MYPSNITLKVEEPDKLSPSGFENIANNNLGRKAGIYRYVNNIQENDCVLKMTAQYVRCHEVD